MAQSALVEKAPEKTMVATNVVSSEKGQALRSKYEAMKAEKPELRARNAAQDLGVSEGELLASRVGVDAIMLSEIEGVLLALAPVGEVMALTRNESVVHERKGVYENVSFTSHGPMRQGIAVNADIDMRMFMNHRKYVFAATEQTRGGPRKSLQFFAKDGEAVHRIYTTSKSDEAAYDAIVTKFTAAEQLDTIAIEKYDAKPADVADSEIDVAGFHQGWRDLKDTHDFYMLLRKFKVGRTQGLRLAEPEFAWKLNPKTVARDVLDRARDKECEIMVFVGNRGNIQIHTGPVKKLLEHENWYNVMDPQFNLHLQEDAIHEAWVTRKPTDDGVVTGVELFDKAGELVCTFFGKRKPGIPELALWREIVADIPKL